MTSLSLSLLVKHERGCSGYLGSYKKNKRKSVHLHCVGESVNCYLFVFNNRISKLIIELYVWLGYHFKGQDNRPNNLVQGHDMPPAGRE